MKKKQRTIGEQFQSVLRAGMSKKTKEDSKTKKRLKDYKLTEARDSYQNNIGKQFILTKDALLSQLQVIADSLNLPIENGKVFAEWLKKILWKKG